MDDAIIIDHIGMIKYMPKSNFQLQAIQWCKGIIASDS